jgi:hypothetical protein
MPQDTLTDTDARLETAATRTDGRLIASNKVEGVPVYNKAGDKLGRIDCFMVDKVSGHSEYAIMSFGGLFGLGDRHYPIPWSLLTYDTGKGGFAVDLDRDKLERAPSYATGEEPAFDRDYDRGVHDYYGLDLDR